jgi:ankyrin repeat protein
VLVADAPLTVTRERVKSWLASQGEREMAEKTSAAWGALPSREAWARVVRNMAERLQTERIVVPALPVSPHPPGLYGRGLLDLERTDEAGRTPLLKAVSAGDSQVVRTLLALGADVQAQDADGTSAVHLAARAGHLGILAALIEAGAQVNARDARGRTALHLAAEQGQAEVVAYLVARALPDAPDGEGWTPLHLAVDGGHEESTRSLLAWSRELDAPGGPGCDTPLHLAARRGHTELARALVERGAKVNIQDRDGRIPLHLAAEEGHTGTVLYLATKSLINTKDNEGRTALQLAEQNQQHNVVALLRSLGGR